MARRRKERDEVDKLVGELMKSATATELLKEGGLLKDPRSGWSRRRSRPR